MYPAPACLGSEDERSGWGNRYINLGTVARKEARNLTALHIFLSFSVASLFIDFTN